MFKYIVPIIVTLFFAVTAMAECPTTSSGPLYAEGMYLGWFVDDNGHGSVAINSKTGPVHAFSSEQDAEYVFGPVNSTYGETVLMRYEHRQFLADNDQCVNITVLTGGNVIKGKSKHADRSTADDAVAVNMKTEQSDIVVFMTCVGANNKNFREKCAEYEPSIAGTLVFEDNGVGFAYFGTYSAPFKYTVSKGGTISTDVNGMHTTYNLVDGKYLVDPDGIENTHIRVTGRDQEVLQYRP